MWAIKGIASSYDKNDPDRVERWVEWLNSPYWSRSMRTVAAQTVADQELAIFAAAMQEE